MRSQQKNGDCLAPILPRPPIAAKRRPLLRGIIAPLVAYVAPATCVGCGHALSSYNRATIEAPLCWHCAEKITPIAEPFCSRCGIPLLSEKNICLRCREVATAPYTNRSLFEYYGVARALIHHYKFKRCTAIARLFAPLLVRMWRQEYHGATIVPVPSSPHNIKKRGWDQILLLLKEMRRYGKIPVLSPLQRRRGASQKLLSRNQRLENARALFSYRGRQQVPPHVVLLDDIYTTGATLEACAELLRAHGAQKIYGLTVAIDL